MFYVLDHAHAKPKFWNSKRRTWVIRLVDATVYSSMGRASASMDKLVHSGAFDTGESGNLIHNSLESHSFDSLERHSWV